MDTLKTTHTIKKPRRIGIFGGSFNPIHIGHIATARHLLDNGLDEVRFLLNPCSPFKAKVKMPDAYHRAQMILRAINSSDNANYASRMSLDTTEMLSSLQSKVCYTVNTLKKILYEDLNDGVQNEYYFIIGTDVFNDLCKGKFKDWRWFIEQKLVHLIPLPRGGYSFTDDIGDFKSIIEYIDFSNFKPIEISSTTIRQYIEAGDEENMKETMYKEEISYIKSLKLYGYPNETDERVQPVMFAQKKENVQELPSTQACREMLERCPYHIVDGTVEDSYVRVTSSFGSYIRHNIYDLVNKRLVFPMWMTSVGKLKCLNSSKPKTKTGGKSFQYDYTRYNTSMFTRSDERYYITVEIPESVTTRGLGNRNLEDIVKFDRESDIEYVFGNDHAIPVRTKINGTFQYQRVISAREICYGLFMLKTTVGSELTYNILTCEKNVTKFESL